MVRRFFPWGEAAARRQQRQLREPHFRRLSVVVVFVLVLLIWVPPLWSSRARALTLVMRVRPRVQPRGRTRCGGFVPAAAFCHLVDRGGTTRGAFDAAAAVAEADDPSLLLCDEKKVREKSVLEAFNNAADRRREAADAAARFPRDNDSLPVLVVDFLDVIRMAVSDGDSAERQADRRRFATDLHNSGGYCLVTMPREETAVLDSMWDCVDALFEEHDRKAAIAATPCGDGIDCRQKQQQKLRHQTLTREDSPDAHRRSGYEFVQVSTDRDGRVSFPPGAIVGTSDVASDQTTAAAAFGMLSQLAKAFAVVVYSGVTGDAAVESTRLVSSLLDEREDDGDSDGDGDQPRIRPFAGTHHRLCRYVDVGAAKPEGPLAVESLRSHTDWTISTAIPVSAEAGLEVYCPIQQAWLCPERVPRQRRPQLREGEESKLPRWHSRYAVVMAGSFLELLTSGRFPATIHRVVSSPGRGGSARRRKSAPLFLRPKESVFERMQARFGRDGVCGDDHKEYDNSHEDGCGAHKQYAVDCSAASVLGAFLASGL